MRQQQRVLGLLVIAIVAGVLLGACGSDSGEGPEESNPVEVIVVTPSGSPTPRVRKTASPSPTPSVTPVQSCSANPDPARPSQLQVEEPAPNSEVEIPVHVRGWGSTIGKDDRGVSLSVVDLKQNVLQVNELPPLPRDYRIAPLGLEVTDDTSPFAADVVLNSVTEPTPYCLWVHLDTTPEGRAVGVVQVPIVVVPAD
jgi:hypothetical protein